MHLKGIVYFCLIMIFGFESILADVTKKSQEINGFKDIAFCESFDSAREKIEKYTATKNIFADRYEGKIQIDYIYLGDIPVRALLFFDHNKKFYGYCVFSLKGRMLDEPELKVDIEFFNNVFTIKFGDPVTKNDFNFSDVLSGYITAINSYCSDKFEIFTGIWLSDYHYYVGGYVYVKTMKSEYENFKNVQKKSNINESSKDF